VLLSHVIRFAIYDRCKPVDEPCFIDCLLVEAGSVDSSVNLSIKIVSSKRCAFRVLRYVIVFKIEKSVYNPLSLLLNFFVALWLTKKFNELLVVIITESAYFV